jgi:hypothetical protein
VEFQSIAPASRRLAGESARFLLPALLVFVCGAFSSVPAGAKTRPSLSLSSRNDANRPDRSRSGRTGSDYVSALASANRFLQAWQNQDHETGLLMLTDAAKQHSSEDQTEAFFSSGVDSAYEIARGRKTKAGGYAFPVTLFPSEPRPTTSDLPQKSRSQKSPQKSKIVVVRTGKDEWSIDRLP